jgi:large subunit ribosomal protein L5e
MNDYNALEGKGKETIRKPFKAFLDIGLTRITTGNKVFGCMKGCVDAGVNIPHSVKKFPGFKKVKGNKKGEYDSEVHSARIHGIHIDE